MRSLPFDREEVWDDGTHVVFRRLPFQFRKKPFVPGRLAAGAKVEVVPLDPQRLFASQLNVTDVGLKQNRHVSVNAIPPTVFAEPDGTYTISDGHHRIAAAWLRGDESIPAVVIYVPHAIGDLGAARGWMRTPGGR
mgnify:CR=1 FL=1